jgi:hypothetical protein
MITALLIALLACAPLPEGAALEDFPAAYAEAGCDFSQRCDGTDDETHALCVDDYTAHYAGVFSEEACDGWDPQLAADCLAEVEAQECDATEQKAVCVELADLCR